MRANVNVNVGPKTPAAEDSLVALKTQELAHRAMKDSPIEPDVNELVQEAKEKPRMLEKRILIRKKEGNVQNLNRRAPNDSNMRNNIRFTRLANRMKRLETGQANQLDRFIRLERRVQSVENNVSWLQEEIGY